MPGPPLPAPNTPPWRIEGEARRRGRGLRRPRLLEVVLAVALVVAALLVAVYRFDPGALGIGSGAAGTAPPPPYQELTKTGDTWLVSDAAPVVLNFTSPAAGRIFMNFTVTGGSVSAFFCPATIVIKPMGWPPCDSQGGLSHANGGIWWWYDGQVYPAELAFINYGATSGSSATVTLVWSSPLVVDGG